jgi:hypothetical protein
MLTEPNDYNDVISQPFLLELIDILASRVAYSINQGIYSLLEAFNLVSKWILADLMADFTQSLGRELGKRFRCHLKCPVCGDLLPLASEDGFLCSNEDCKEARGVLIEI